jgi:predicted dehydrogenase
MHVVVLGTGSIGLRHVTVLQSLAAAGEAVQVTAVPSRPERVAELTARGINALATLDEALARRPSGVVVATDTGRHASDAEVCLSVCPVLVEKPMTASGAQATRLVEVARASGHALHVACCLRFDDGLAWAHHRIPELGRPHLLDIECLSWLPSWRPRRDLLSSYSARPGEGGVLLDLIHEIDSCFWFAGPWQSVLAHIENRGLVGLPDTVEETALLTGRHASGLASSVRLSYSVKQPTRRLRMWGERGALEWNGVDRMARLWDAAGEEKERFSWTGPDAMYRAQMRAWLDSLRGEPSPRLVEGKEGAYEVELCDAARRSGSTHRREEIL